MSTNIFLNNNAGYDWFVKGNVHIKGSFFDSNNNLVNHNSLADNLVSLASFNEFEEIIKSLNGVFCIVAMISDTIYIATDITRTFPIFYTKYENQWIVSDNAVFLKEKYDLSFCEEAQKEFKCLGYVSGNKTLLKDLYQIQSAEVVCLAQDTVTAQEYWTYASSENTNKSFSDLQKDLLGVYERLTKRLIRTANGNTIVIPLSGGYDSRLVLTLLVKYGYKNIFCFTYGVSTSFEVSIAKKVANKLNVQLEVIEYSNEFIDKYFDREEYFKYFVYGSNYVSLSHVQDFLAIKYLYNKKIISQDSIFAPGHSGDIFSGTHLSRKVGKNATSYSIKKEIINKHFTLDEKQSFKINYYDDLCYPYSNLEAWSWKERQSKYIVNSLHVYSFFDYKFALPLWDFELANFFKSVPLSYKNRNFIFDYKVENNLYDSVSFLIFEDFDVGFSRLNNSVFYTFVKKAVNKIFRIIDLSRNSDVNNFNYLAFKIDECEESINKLFLARMIDVNLKLLKLNNEISE